MNISAVIFDLDGTLIDSMGVWAKIDIDFLAKRGLNVPADYAGEVCARSFLDVAYYTIERFSLKETADMLIREWNEMAAYEYGHNIVLKPYAKEYLELLKSRNIKLGIATSLPASLYEPVLVHNKVHALFDVICSTGEVKRDKSFPDVFLYTAEKLRVSPENCLVFEDIIQAVRSAKSAGMTVYGVYDDSSKEHWEEIKRIADGVLYDFQNAPIPG